MNYIIDYSYLVPLSIAAVLSLKTFRLGWPGDLKFFSYFMFLTVIAEVCAISWKWWLYRGTGFSYDNLWVYNMFLPFRYLLLFGFFYNLLTSSRVKAFLRFIALPFLILAILNYFFWEKPHSVPTYAITFCNLLTIFLSMVFFYQVLHTPTFIRLTRTSQAWICLGLFLYHTVVLPFFMFFSYLNGYEPSLAASYLYINNALNFIASTLYLIAYLCRPLSSR